MSDYHPRLSDVGMRSSIYWAYTYGTHPFNVRMPNCCTYALGRIHENWVDQGGTWSDITHANDPSFWNQGPTYHNAYTWWTEAAAAGPAHGWTRSSTPALGAVACWNDRNGEGGHVAIVEEMEANGYCTFSMSEYGGQYFRTRRMRPTVGLQQYGYGAFQGYLINPLTAGENPGTPVGPSGGIPFIPFRRGEWIKIIQAGNANSYGTGRRAYGIGWKRQIIQIYEGRPFPYRVGDYGTGATTGFYKASALKKI